MTKSNAKLSLLSFYRSAEPAQDTKRRGLLVTAGRCCTTTTTTCATCIEVSSE